MSGQSLAAKLLAQGRDQGDRMPEIQRDVLPIPDWTQANDLAAEQPEKLSELQQLFLDEAKKYNVLPLDDRRQSASTPISRAARS